MMAYTVLEWEWDCCYQWRTVDQRLKTGEDPEKMCLSAWAPESASPELSQRPSRAAKARDCGQIGVHLSEHYVRRRLVLHVCSESCGMIEIEAAS